MSTNCFASHIVLSFPTEMPLDAAFQRNLNDLVLDLCRDWEQKNPGKVMWPFQVGFPDEQNDRYQVVVMHRDDIHRTRRQEDPDAPRIRTYVVRHDGRWVVHSGVQEAVDEAAGLLKSCLPGEQVVVKCVEMTQGAYDAMEEFTGW